MPPFLRYLEKTSGGGADIRPPVGARVKTVRCKKCAIICMINIQIIVSVKKCLHATCMLGLINIVMYISLVGVKKILFMRSLISLLSAGAD